jgi:hypothetical protein
MKLHGTIYIVKLREVDLPGGPPSAYSWCTQVFGGPREVTANMSNSAHARVGLAVLASLMALACAKGGSTATTLPSGSKGEGGVCGGNRVTATDVNDDGRADIEHVERGGRTYCTRTDMNFDGKFDVERFYEEDGVSIAQERHDFDFDGRLDQLSFYKDGVLVRKELDTNFDNTIDTWLWCGGGWVVKAERDRQRDGKADVWETYSQGVMVEAEYDENNDGQVDRWDSFRNGKLVLTQYDDNRDGEPDRSHEMPLQSLGPADDVLRCESTTQAEVATLFGGSRL